MDNNTFASGGCRCGGITLTTSSPPQMTTRYHGQDRQKAIGTGQVFLAFIAENDVQPNEMANGSPVTTDRGHQRARYFCLNCGSHLYGKNSDRPGIISIAVDGLDDNSRDPPHVVVDCKHRQVGNVLHTAVPNLDERSPPVSNS